MDQVSQVNRSSELQRDPLSETLSIVWRVLLMAAFLATLYTAWSPSGLFSEAAVAAVPYQGEEGEQQSLAFVSTPTPRSIRIGIIAGHWGNDSGAVCADGLKEVEVNLAVAALAQKMLVNEGIPVDLLKEKDARLNGYNGTLLLSIHADSCDYINDAASGFKVAGNDNADSSNRLVPCLNENFEKVTELKRHPSSITHDMTEYHAFDKISADTPAAIIEVGFLNLDRQILTQRPDLIAKGVVEGLKCFLNYGEVESNRSGELAPAQP